MTVLAVPTVEHTPAEVQPFDPMKDKTYRGTALGPHVVDWLAYLELGGYADKTIDGYERTLSRLCLRYPNLGLTDFDDGHLAHTLRSWPKRSQRVRSYHFASFFRWAIRVRRITQNPVEFLPPMRANARKHIDVFTEAEIDDLYALPIIDAALMGLLFGAGLRKSEATAMQVRRIRLDPPPATVVVIGGKGDKDRVIRIEERPAQLLRDLLLFERLGPQDRLWYLRPGGGPRIVRDRDATGTSFENWWTRCLDRAGVRYRNPHVARHTYATRWLRAGGRLETLKDQMGHAKISTTFDLYAHLDERDVLADLAVIEEARRITKESGG